MSVQLKAPARGATPIRCVDRASFDAQLQAAPATTRRWLQAVAFSGAPDSHALVPAADGSLLEVWAGVRAADFPWALAALPKALPAGRYWLHGDGLSIDTEAAAMSWELGSYSFDLYKPAKREPATLMLASSPEQENIRSPRMVI